MPEEKSLLSEDARQQREADKQLQAKKRSEFQATLERNQQLSAKTRQMAEQSSNINDKKERTRVYTGVRKLYIESRNREVEMRNNLVETRLKEASTILARAISINPVLDLDKLKQPKKIPDFDPGELAVKPSPPDRRAYIRNEQDLSNGSKRFEADVAAYATKEAARQRALVEARAKYAYDVEQLLEGAKPHNALIEKLKQDFAAGVADAISDYYLTRLMLITWPYDYPDHARVAYIPESRQLVVEHDLPPFEIIPEVGSYKYVQTKDEIIETLLPANQRKSRYNSLIAQIVLTILHMLFNAKRTDFVETIVLNGYVDSIDRATGRPIRPCLVTVRTTRETFDQLDLSKVDPAACLKFLSASVSKSPAELAPVRPVLELDMIDSRFIEETDVVSQLDQRPNLMDLSPAEFESLITNLFQLMGLETRQTQASRDGGVDCVAFDNRPIFGGKVVIQAKRYKHTVGVAAVRDLYGTVLNEGASKGILITTSGYGEASFEFAKGKPLELFSGSNLLALLAEYGLEAKIVMPEDWKDPHPDTGDTN